MPVALSRTAVVDHAAPASTSVWKHLVILALAGLFVSMLVMSYGVDLSPGLF